MTPEWPDMHIPVLSEPELGVYPFGGLGEHTHERIQFSH